MVFAAQHIITRNKVETISASGEKERNLKKARIVAIPIRAIRT
jgi:hypothetical protein